MSQLSTNTKVVYAPVYYPQQPYHNEYDYYETEEEAIEEARRYIANHILVTDEYLYATIEKE